MNATRNRFFKLMACATMFGCLMSLNPLSAYNCGCSDENSNRCNCTPFCNCEVDSSKESSASKTIALADNCDCGSSGENSDRCNCTPFCNCKAAASDGEPASKTIALAEDKSSSEKQRDDDTPSASDADTYTAEKSYKEVQAEDYSSESNLKAFEDNTYSENSSCKESTPVKAPCAAPSTNEDCNADCRSCCGIKGVEFGVDYLYWHPCVSGLQYAAKRQHIDSDSFRKFEFHYVKPSSASGFRLNFATLFTLEGLSLKATYTDVKFHDGSKVFSSEGCVTLSKGTPHEIGPFDRAKGHLDMNYQTVEAVLAYSLTMDSLEITPYGGVDALAYDKKFNVAGINAFAEPIFGTKIRKHQHYFGAGPMFGVGTSYAFSKCINVFVDVNASLFIGRQEEEDHFTDWEEESIISKCRYKSDDCYCFPGWHLTLGVGFKKCICGFETALRIGYEFVQYTNAPWFLDYDRDDCQVNTSTEANNLTLRGLFAGANIAF